MDDIGADFGELIFALVISYVGALEFFFVLRHLCHLSGRHEESNEIDAESLQELKDKMRRQLADAMEKEKQSGPNSMKDGILYKSGFRIDPDQAEIDRLKGNINAKDAKDKRRAEIEVELARQRKIEEETRKQLEAAEAELARQRSNAEKEEQQKQKEQQQQKKEQQQQLEEAENYRRLLEAEKLREVEQRRLEEETEKLAKECVDEAHRKLEEEEANLQKFLEAKKQKENEQRMLEEEENKPKRQQTEMEEEETESERKLLATEKKLEDFQRYHEESRAGMLEEFLEAEKIDKQKQEREQKHKIIEENARIFLEAEKKMVQLQKKIIESAPHGDSLTFVEEPILKHTQMRVDASAPTPNEQPMQTVKTQFGQGSNESFTLSSKSILFPSISDDASSNEPYSSTQSSFSTQPSEETPNRTEKASKTTIGLQIPQHERQEPDGEDTTSSIQYTEDYLRSLDGLKARSLIREDGSGRRRAFKKRRSSGSSNSSRESRTSRDEEIKMFTSLEEEEMKNSQGADDDYTPIKYTNDTTLKVKGHHHRRHKRSPAKDTRTAEDNLHTTLEMLGEEGTDPWGEVVPEHYKNTEFWRREKAMSINEEEVEMDSSPKSEETKTDSANNKPNSSSFEEATAQQNQEAMSTLQKQLSKEPVDREESPEVNVDTQTNKNKDANLQPSQETEGSASPSHNSASPCLRRSPRIDEIDEYEEHWNELETPVKSNSENINQPESPMLPTIAVHSSGNVASWRDDHGLMMQGLSDFYDFTASINPSRSNSRNASPASSKSGTPLPNNSRFNFNDGKGRNEPALASNDFKVYANTGNFVDIGTKHIADFIQSLHDEHTAVDPVESQNSTALNVELLKGECNPSITKATTNRSEFVESNKEKDFNEEINLKGDDMNQLIENLRKDRQRSKSRSRSPLPTAKNIEKNLEIRKSKIVRENDENVESFPETYHNDDKQIIAPDANEDFKCSQNVLNPDTGRLRDIRRSRSRSPLPTRDNIERSKETRRNKLIQRNDDTLEELSAKDIKLYYKQPSMEKNAVPIINIENNDYKDIQEETSDAQNEMNVLIETLRRDRQASRSRSRSPLPTAENIVQSLDTRRSNLIRHNEEIFESLSEKYQNGGKKIELKTTENILKPDEERLSNGRRSRSRSPLPTSDNIERSLEIRRNKLIQHNDDIFEKLSDNLKSQRPPAILIDQAEDESGNDGKSSEDMTSLVATLRVARSRSRSKSPMRIPNPENLRESINHRREKLIERNDILQKHLEGHAQAPSELIVEYVYEIEEAAEDSSKVTTDERNARSRTPSRSPSSDFSDLDFGRMLNLESSQNRTLSKDTAEMESMLAEKQRHLDEEALQKLKTASEETELRTLIPSDLMDRHSDDEQIDTLPDLPAKKRLQKQHYPPISPDYDRTISEEWRDFERIKQDMLKSSFKRSKYVGESMELGSEYEPLRREAANFRRSRSPTPSLEEQKLENPECSGGIVKQTAAERRRIQDEILKELILNSSRETEKENTDQHGAKPKTERKLSDDYSCSLSKEIHDTERIKKGVLSSGFQRSTYVDESVDNGESYEGMRREMADFRRSRSCSRSPVNERNNEDLIAIEMESAKREVQDKILDKLSAGPVNFENFSRHLNADFLEDRRASDSALIQKFDTSIKFGENNYDLDIEPDEYHHYRRFSLNQEQQIEEYPDDDFIYISQVEVHRLDGRGTWMQENYYFEDMDLNHGGMELAHDEEESEDSEDERQTVVEVDDEIDTDICDYNERGPMDESHHEQSECEEADRAMDHYANRDAADWQSVTDLADSNDRRVDEEGAVGGMDSDSCEIDQIYDEAIKNRKQSGILREYDSILLEMQNNFERNLEHANEMNGELSDRERYALWSKSRTHERGDDRKLSVTFVETEKQDTELRYLGDANTNSRQSTRLRSRYGYEPHLVNGGKSLEGIEDEASYIPKREYNWRKNFRLDDDDDDGNDKNNKAKVGTELVNNQVTDSLNGNKEPFEEYQDFDDYRKFSLGGESITLYSRSPDRISPELLQEEYNFEENVITEPIDDHDKDNASLIVERVIEKSKKKKSKKKAHRESKESIENRYEDDDDSDSQVYSRRNSNNRQMETELPKRKSRSRRGSRSSVDSMILFSPRSSIAAGETITDKTLPPNSELNEAQTKKNVKKRKKAKDAFTAAAQNIKEEQEQMNEELVVDQLQNGELENLDEGNTLRPQNNVSMETVILDACTNNSTTITAATMTTTTSSSVEKFDILKDANFYPLF